jgi:hypothetical protein
MQERKTLQILSKSIEKEGFKMKREKSQILKLAIVLFAVVFILQVYSRQSDIQEELKNVNAEIKHLEETERYWSRVVDDSDLIIFPLSLEGKYPPTFVLRRSQVLEQLESMQTLFQPLVYTKEEVKRIFQRMISRNAELKLRVRNDLLPKLRDKIADLIKYRDNLRSMIDHKDESKAFKLVSAKHENCNCSGTQAVRKDLIIKYSGNPTFPLWVYTDIISWTPKIDTNFGPYKTIFLIHDETVDTKKKELIWKNIPLCAHCWYLRDRGIKELTVTRKVWFVDDEKRKSNEVKLIYKCIFPEKK